MKELSEKEKNEIYAGNLSAGAYALIGVVVSFAIGIVDGITRPFKCR